MAKYIDDQYRIIRSITGGNMSKVYLCDDDKDNRVVIKMFDKCCNGEDDLQEKLFQREVESLEKVQHKNIVKILGKGIDERLEKFYIVLEYIDGKSFEDAFDELCNYDYYSKIDLMQQVIEGVEYLHKKNIVHRDLKPSNIMFNSNNIVKIIDFGISKLTDTFYSEYTVCNYSTPKYRSPEQARGKNITYKSDIYSLGLIFYEIFISSKIKDNEKCNISKLPEEVQSIFDRMLKEEQELRYISVSEIKKDLISIKEKVLQENFLSLGITNTVADILHQYNRIERNELTLAAVELEKDCEGKVYIKSNKYANGDTGYWIIGKQYVMTCKIDNRNSRRFTITGIKFCNLADLNSYKEISYQVLYNIKVVASSNRAILPQEIDVNDLIRDLVAYEVNYNTQRKQDKHVKDIAGKWHEILKLQREKIEEEKLTVRYKQFIVNDKENCIEVTLDKNVQDIEFTSDAMLTMTAKNSMFRQYNIGYMRECSNGIMIIDLDRNAYVENIASSGEISISKNLAEIALGRQTKALKNLRFKDIVNPNISDIIFNPKNANSRGDVVLGPKDFKSNLIDKSKLISLEKALSAEDIFLLQGPPGTGKTTFIGELVYQILKNKPQSKILIASQSHVAVDHSLTKIKDLMSDIKMIRIGIKEKFSDSVINYTLDAFCREWTNSVIEKCREAILSYKLSMGLDDSLQRKNSILLEIEELHQDMEQFQEKLMMVEDEKNRIELLSDKWKHINNKIDSMKSLISVKKSKLEERELIAIIDNFSDQISKLNSGLETVIEESIQIAEKRGKLEQEERAIKHKLTSVGQEINNKKGELNITSYDEYQIIAKEIKEALKENQVKYNQFSKIENLCKEWINRVQVGDGLLQESLVDATIVGATCLGIASLSSSVDLQFDWVIVDEAGKATPPEILVPINLGKKVVLVGDHKQLPPVVDENLLKSYEGNKINLTKKDLETSLFEYLEENLNEECKSVLDEQYRMNPVIGEIISQLFYDGKLKSGAKKEAKTIPLSIFDSKPLVWLSTAKMSDNKEEVLGTGQYSTYRNRCEANVIFDYLIKINTELEELNLNKEVSIIAGYRAQRDLLNTLYESQYLHKLNRMKLEINTVDAFQGRETDIVLYSIVRSNDKGNLGFLKDVRRLNVAFSRARELLIVVGNHQSVTKRISISGEANPFVDVMQYIYSKPEDCLVREVL